MGRQDPAARRVSNLSSSQIERKRAIDRANQQHCQQRKKARLQWLETEVARLATELEVAQSKIKDFEDACTCGLHHNHHREHHHRRQQQQQQQQQREDSQEEQHQQHQQQHESYQLHPRDVVHRLPSPQDEPALLMKRPRSLGSLSLPSGSSPTSTSLDRCIFSHIPLSTRTAFTEAVCTVHLCELLDPSQLNLDNSNNKLASIVFEYPLPPPDNILLPPPIPQLGDVLEWSAVPLHLPPESDLDRLIVDLTNSGRRLQEQQQKQTASGGVGGGTDELSQAQFLSISSLLNPNLGEGYEGDDGTGTNKPTTAAMAIHVVRDSTVRSVPTRIALLYMLSHLMRWLVCRNQKSYEKLPGFFRPTLLQRTVPHPAWVDVVIWPEARDSIIRSRLWQDMSLDEFQRGTARSLSVNWPYADVAAIFEPGPAAAAAAAEQQLPGDGQKLTLSPVFEQHIRRAENWTLGRSIASHVTFLEDFCVGPDVDDE